MGAFWAHLFGLDDPSGPIYLAWSGVGGDIGELAVIGALIGLIRRHNCHVHRCPRLGRHPVAGTTFVVCRRHHPNGAPTAADVREAGVASSRSGALSAGK